ncbi:NAD(P)/FAD-dependent oxidoreductase [Coralloluteibacterium thermophilus]|uniref:NAD(P)/FAD-dependent oxidoreductase n=1 Tax=Coralloluteibacterium thermophilum TaxID=2707049 RepID=A0ABV9NIP5_9GAMM
MRDALARAMERPLTPVHDAPSALPSASDATAAAAPRPGAAAVETTDVLVVGGGPGGSTVATLLARRGWRVVLLEKARHPRFHIGESLLPMNMPILKRLGVYEQVAAIGVRKLGADFPLDATRYNTFRFSRALDPKADHAFQVRRADFDQLLFAHARGAGVDAREGVRVLRVALPAAEDGTATVDAVGEDGTALRFEARHVVDASGRDAFLGGKLGLKRKNPVHQSAAVFSHYRGVARRPGEDAGNITVQRFEHGWMWLIPLPDDVMSVGAVCYPEYLKTRRGDTEGFLQRTLESVPAVAARMAGAERVAPVHVTGNYSYTCTRMTGPGWTLVGDAYAFLDPIFSSGVFLAMHGAERAADLVDASLRAPATAPRLRRRFERDLKRGLDEFSWFITRFNAPAVRELFRKPRNAWQIEQAVIAMLAGDVFDAPRVRRRLRAFRVLYGITALGRLRESFGNWRRRRRQRTVEIVDETLQRDGS